MRGNTLANLVTMLKAELGDSLTIGSQADALYKQLLESEQKYLVTERAFPFLEERWDKSVTAGGRYLAFPTTTIDGETDVAIDFERPFKVEVSWNERWYELTYGIGSVEYNYQNSDNDERLDPIQKWRYNGSSEFEVWPLPSSDTTVRFTGQRALPALIADGDTAVLDDELLVLSVAIPILTKRDSKDASFKLSRLQRRLQRLFGMYQQQNQTFSFGESQHNDRRSIRKAKLVVVA